MTDAVGWICPRCKNSLAPSLPICPYCAVHAEDVNRVMEKEAVRFVGGQKETDSGMIKES